MHKSVNETPLSTNWIDSTGLFNIRIQAAESANTATLLLFQIQVVRHVSQPLVTGDWTCMLRLLKRPLLKLTYLHLPTSHTSNAMLRVLVLLRATFEEVSPEEQNNVTRSKSYFFLSGDFIKKGLDRKGTRTRSLVRCGVTARGGSPPVGLMKWFGEQTFPVRGGWGYCFSSIRLSLWTVSCTYIVIIYRKELALYSQ